MEEKPRRRSKFTQRELQILKLLALDYSNEEICKELHIRTKTVEKNIETLKIKFRATTRANLAVKAVPLIL